MPGDFDAQVGLGPAACSGLPAGAGSLPRSLPCEAPAQCVFRILGNGQGAPARAACRSRHAHGGRGRARHAPPTTVGLASAKGPPGQSILPIHLFKMTNSVYLFLKPFLLYNCRLENMHICIIRLYNRDFLDVVGFHNVRFQILWGSILKLTSQSMA